MKKKILAAAILMFAFASIGLAEEMDKREPKFG